MAAVTPPMSNRFFEALACKNYNELIQLYGEAAVTALKSYQNMQMRWDTAQQREIGSGRGKTCLWFTTMLVFVLLLGSTTCTRVCYTEVKRVRFERIPCDAFLTEHHQRTNSASFSRLIFDSYVFSCLILSNEPSGLRGKDGRIPHPSH